MAINSFKICPECGHKNSLEFIECEKCEADLQGVKVTLIDDSKKIEEVKQVKEEVVEETKPTLIKQCPNCNHINKANAKICEKCNFDLILVIATFPTTSKKEKKRQLS